MNTISERLKDLLSKKNGGNQSELARYVGVSPQAVQKWISGKSAPEGKNLELCASFLGISPAFLQYGESWGMFGGEKETFEVKEAAPAYKEEMGKIEYWDVRGSCGDGIQAYEPLPKGHLIKEATFFRKYDVKPENAFAIYAEGNSMADFIVDGDIVIFDKSKTAPVSGAIFAIEHPDGLRIKALRRTIDGTWVLESRNPDKRRYPDETIQPEQAGMLKIYGRFIYRQGG